MRWFWQREKSVPIQKEAPDTALRSYPYLWRTSDRKRFALQPNGLYAADDGEEIDLYLIQQIRCGEKGGYILHQRGDHFPMGSQYFPKMPMPRQQELLKQLDQSEAGHLGAAK